MWLVRDWLAKMVPVVSLRSYWPAGWCRSVDLSVRGGAAGTVRPTSVT
jgi:hypothetical protein